MIKIIRIETCKECTNRDHKGAFGRISYIPICRKAGMELPYTEHKGKASPTYEIPDWCPLENLEE